MSRRLLAVFGFVAVAGCSSDATVDASGSSAPSSKQAASSGPQHVASGPSAVAPKPPPKKADKGSTGTQKTVAKHLTEGRKLAQKKDFKAALAEFDKALAVAPKDARVLAESSWAAFKADDKDRAKKDATLALANTRDPKLRAQILYTRGRTNQESGDKDAAKADYAESLGLRDNEEVAKRFAEVGGKPDEVIARWSTCTDGYATVKDLCSCLVAKADKLLYLGGEGKPTCEAAPKSDLGDPRLSVVRLNGPGPGTESIAILVAEDKKKLRAVADLGRDYEPGAFGVHNSVEVSGGKKLAKGAIVAVHHKQNNLDTNLGGLEACEDVSELETLCVLGKGDSATFCPRTLPVASVSGCGPNSDIDPKDLDADTQAALDEVKANEKKTTTKLKWSVDDAGVLEVSVAEGDAANVTKALLGKTPLLAP
ncbi:MAG: tetratricopeptide repeat protein [Polyangiaceae bacterium]